MIPIRPSYAKILLSKSPAHARASIDNPRKSTPALEMGSYVDWLVFGGTEPDATPKTKKDAEPIARAALERVAKIGPWHGQRTLNWTADGGVLCSGTPDLVMDDYSEIIDLKTAADLSDNGLTRAIELFGYDLQLAAYSEAIGVLHGKSPVLKLLFVEKSSPYETRMLTLDARYVGQGTAAWRKACAIWKDCHETGVWPGRGDMTVGPSKYRTASQGSVFDDLP